MILNEIFILSFLYTVLDSLFSTINVIISFDPKRKKQAFIAYFISRMLFSNFQSLINSYIFPVLSIGITFATIYLFFDNNLCRGVTRTVIMELIMSPILLLLSTPIFRLSALITHVEYSGIIIYSPELTSADFINAYISDIMLWSALLPLSFVFRFIFQKVAIPQKVNVATTILFSVYIFLRSAMGVYTTMLSAKQLSADKIYVALMLVLLVSVIVKLIFDNYLKKKAQVENKYLSELIQLQRQHYDALNKHQQQIRMMRHDIVNHLHTMQIMLENGEREKCCNYTQEILNNYKAHQINHCENKIVDAVIYLKFSEAAERNVKLDINTSIPDNIHISDVDLVCLFSNLLDNAIAAAEDSSEKSICLSANIVNGALTIKCENSFSGKINVKKDGSIATTKGDDFSHGLGTKIIRNITELYFGNVHYYVENKLFTCIVFIPLKNNNIDKQECITT